MHILVLGLLGEGEMTGLGVSQQAFVTIHQTVDFFYRWFT